LSEVAQELEALVRSRFTVKEFFSLPEAELEFQIVYDEGTKEKFAGLEAELKPHGYRPQLTGSKGECILQLRKEEPASLKGSRVPVLFALFTMASVIVFALLQRIQYEQLAPSLSGYYVLSSFVVGIAALLGVHELAQRIVARRRRAGHAGSFAIPGVPLLPPFIPSLGFVSAQRTPAVNRDRLFDAVVAGPLAILAIAILMSAVGDLTSVQSTTLYQWVHTSNSTFVSNPSAIEMTIGAILHPYLPIVLAGALPASPIADAASVGFILVFIGLLPMAIYDGGFLTTIAWGEKAARVATYLSVLFLLILDTSFATYWAVAIVALLLAGRPAKLKLLDEVTGLSASRQWVFVGTLILAFLCMPVPHSIATFPLP
jgi:hypothetical protein